MKSASLFDDPSILLILTYAPAGLGHLRVTDALYHGLPEGVTPVILGANDPSITFIHRIFSTHPITRAIMEWAQNGIGEAVFTAVYRYQLRRSSGYLYRQLADELTQRIHVPKTVVVVATHFGLAHQLAYIKNRFEREHTIKIILIVQITDDTTQQIWYVEGADLILVPSEHAKELFERMHRRLHLTAVRIEVNPYPVSPLLGERISQGVYHNRRSQLEAHTQSRIHTAVPISGAAVGTDWFLEMMARLHQESERFVFHVLCKKAPFTLRFIERVKDRSYIELLTTEHDREIVDLYETLYAKRHIALEITKPSEQAFKALLTPKQFGGSVLLFAQPVGRQERENLDFLRRHGLIPNSEEQEHLWEQSRSGIAAEIDKVCWRGLLLPAEPKEAAIYIDWCLTNGILAAMQARGISCNDGTLEGQSNGVALFWQKVTRFVQEKALIRSE